MTDDLCSPSALRAMEEDGEIDRAVWRELVNGEWLGLSLPAEAGGHGQPFLDFQLLLLELGRVGSTAPVRSAVVTCTQFMGLRFGDAVGVRDFVERVAKRGEIRVAAVAERGWLSRGELTSVHDAPAATVSGMKEFVRDARDADGFLVAASAVGGDVVWLAVENDPAHVTVEPIPNTAGEGQYVVRFDAAPAEALADGPASALAEWHTLHRLADATWGTGLMTRILELAVAHAEQREQFGRPIGSFQSAQHLLAEMATDVQLCMNLCRTAGSELDAESLGDTATFAAAAEAHDAVRRRGAAVVRRAHHIFGGLGFVTEGDLQLFTRRLKALVLFGDDALDARREIMLARFPSLLTETVAWPS
jgi:alkylation response protein AidB-like acyl-CoA dehydrogenase